MRESPHASQRLAAVLEEARVAAVAAATQGGVALTVDVRDNVVTFDDAGNGWGVGEAEFTDSCMVNRHTAATLCNASDLTTGASREAVARLLADEFPPDAIPRMPWEEVPRNPVAAINDRVLTPTVHEYLRRLPALDVGDETLAIALIDEVTTLLRTRSYRVRLSAFLDGLRTETPLVMVDNVTVRQLTARESAAVAASTGTRSHGPLGFIPTRAMGGIAPRHDLVVTTATDREGVRLGVANGGTLPRIIASLLLDGFDIAGTGFYSEIPEPSWLVRTARGNPLPMAEHARSQQLLTATALERVVRRAESLPPTLGGHPDSPDTFALHRFLLGCSRRDPADAVVDFVIAMESALLRGQQGEPTFRFAVNGSTLLHPSPSPDRRRTFEDLKALYETRSAIVHGGGRFPSPAKLAEQQDRARRYSERVLLRAVDEGWPDRTRFTDLIVGEGPPADE